jgi:hypothetical protein
MISECFNSSCRKELKYLRDGRVVRVIREEAGGLALEHFWLCGACHLNYDFCFSNDWTLTIAPRIARNWQKVYPELQWIEEPLAS